MTVVAAGEMVVAAAQLGWCKGTVTDQLIGSHAS